MDDATQQLALANYMRRALADGSLTLAQVKQYSLDAFAKQLDGTTVIEVTFEGGVTRGAVNCNPALLMGACEAIIAEQDPANPLSATDPRHRYADFSGGRIET